MKPERKNIGDGPPCPANTRHGKLVSLEPSTRLWCPVCDSIYGPLVHNGDKWAAGPLLRASSRKEKVS